MNSNSSPKSSSYQAQQNSILASRSNALGSMQQQQKTNYLIQFGVFSTIALLCYSPVIQMKLHNAKIQREMQRNPISFQNSIKSSMNNHNNSVKMHLPVAPQKNHKGKSIAFFAFGIGLSYLGEKVLTQATAKRSEQAKQYQ
eukprot:403350487